MAGRRGRHRTHGTAAAAADRRRPATGHGGPGGLGPRRGAGTAARRPGPAAVRVAGRARLGRHAAPAAAASHRRNQRGRPEPAAPVRAISTGRRGSGQRRARDRRSGHDRAVGPSSGAGHGTDHRAAAAAVRRRRHRARRARLLPDPRARAPAARPRRAVPVRQRRPRPERGGDRDGGAQRRRPPPFPAGDARLDRGRRARSTSGCRSRRRTWPPRRKTTLDVRQGLRHLELHRGEAAYAAKLNGLVTPHEVPATLSPTTRRPAWPGSGRADKQVSTGQRHDRLDQLVRRQPGTRSRSRSPSPRRSRRPQPASSRPASTPSRSSPSGGGWQVERHRAVHTRQRQPHEPPCTRADHRRPRRHGAASPSWWCRCWSSAASPLLFAGGCGRELRATGHARAAGRVHGGGQLDPVQLPASGSSGSACSTTCRGRSWPASAKVESDDGRTTLPGVTQRLERVRRGRADADRHRGASGNPWGGAPIHKASVVVTASPPTRTATGSRQRVRPGRRDRRRGQVPGRARRAAERPRRRSSPTTTRTGTSRRCSPGRRRTRPAGSRSPRSRPERRQHRDRRTGGQPTCNGTASSPPSSRRTRS